MGTVASPEQLEQLIHTYLTYRQSLGEDYTPTYHFFSPPEGGVTLFDNTLWDSNTNAPPSSLPGQEGEVAPGSGGISLPDDPLQSAWANDPNFVRDWTVHQDELALSAGGQQADDSFQGFVANVFGNSFTLPALFVGGAMGANAAGNLAVQAGTSGVNLTQHPSGSGVGGALGSLATGATGIPGLGLAGSLAGGAVQGAFSGSGGDGTMADGTENGGGNWAQLLPLLLAMGGGASGSGESGGLNWAQIIPALLGLAGGGLGVAGNVGLQQQQQKLYDLLLNLAQQYQGQLDTYNQRTQATDTTRQGQVTQDLTNRQQTFDAKNAIAGRLQDPAQVLAGQQAFYQPMSQQAHDRVAQDTYRQLAARGLVEGQAGNLVLDQAFVPYELQQQQQALQNYLASQGQAAQTFGYAPAGELTPTPTQPASALASFAQASNVLPHPQDTGQMFGNLGTSVGQLLQGLGLGSMGGMAGVGSAGLAGLSNFLPQLLRTMGVNPSTYLSGATDVGGTPATLPGPETMSLYDSGEYSDYGEYFPNFGNEY